MSYTRPVNQTTTTIDQKVSPPFESGVKGPKPEDRQRKSAHIVNAYKQGIANRMSHASPEARASKQLSPHKLPPKPTSPKNIAHRTGIHVYRKTANNPTIATQDEKQPPNIEIGGATSPRKEEMMKS
jgi:hypothetical protein